MQNSSWAMQLLNTLSHDIRTPLNAMLLTINALEMKLGRKLNENDRTDFDTLRSGIWAILDLHTGILEHAKQSSSQVTLECKDFSLDDVLTQCARLVQPLAAQKGLPIFLDLQIQERLKSDRTMIHHVVENLLSNAVRYTNKGHIILRSRRDPYGVCIEVEDTGVGICAEDRSRIFEAYFQADSAKVSGEGVGLGLAMARQTARALGGELSMESQPGKGSIFTFRLSTQSDSFSPTDKLTAGTPGTPHHAAVDEIPLTDCPSLPAPLTRALRPTRPKSPGSCDVRQ